MTIVEQILKLDEDKTIYWRVQDARFPLPKASTSAWSDFEYKDGQVSFFADLVNAVDCLLGESDPWGNNYANEIQENGGKPVLLAATSEYEIEDAPGTEIILWEPIEVARFSLSKIQLKELRSMLKQ